MNVTKLAAYSGAAVVGAVAAVVSFGHLRHLALSAGEASLAAGLLPISVDGLLASSAAVMVADKQAGRRPRTSARVSFGAGCVATVAGNIGAASPTPVGWLVAAWAPLALLLVTEMLARTGTEPATRQNGVSATQSQDQGGTPTRVRTKPARKPTGERVAAAMARTPSATPAELAVRLRLSERTVHRYLPADAKSLLVSSEVASPNGGPS
jgi:hypothetical protein